MEENDFKKPNECPVCHAKEVRRISGQSDRYQCRLCAHQFTVPGEGNQKRDFDLPSPEDHDL